MTSKYFVTSRPAVKIYPDGREVCNTGSASGAGRIEYNARKVAMVHRQGELCPLCGSGGWFTFDHQSGRGSNGAHRDDRIEVDGQWQNAALCHKCNIEKGSKRYHWKDGAYIPKERT